MRRLISWATATAVALVIPAVAGAAMVPTVRHVVSGLWNTPDRLPALSGNRQIHYQRGADDYARVVSAVLPAAIARIEAGPMVDLSYIRCLWACMRLQMALAPLGQPALHSSVA